MGYCRRIDYPGGLRACQVFWPDADGKFPFQPGCDLDTYRSQPRLDVSLTPREFRAIQRRFS